MVSATRRVVPGDVAKFEKTAKSQVRKTWRFLPVSWKTDNCRQVFRAWRFRSFSNLATSPGTARLVADIGFFFLEIWTGKKLQWKNHGFWYCIVPRSWRYSLLSPLVWTVNVARYQVPYGVAVFPLAVAQCNMQCFSMVLPQVNSVTCFYILYALRRA